MLMDTAFFYIFAAMTLGGALFTITRRNPVHSAISLIVSLLGVAGLYLMQNADFLFAVQIVLYVGGIMVLFLFVIMLVNLDSAAREKQFNGQWLVALAAVVAVAAVGGWFLYHGRSAFHIAEPAYGAFAAGGGGAIGGAAIGGAGNIERLADSLFQDYLLPFEIASVLLLVAVVGSVIMAKKRI